MKLKSEVIQMRKWLGLSLFLILGVGTAKADTVNCLGGGCPALPVSLSSSASGVTAGAYTNTNLTVDVNGRITAAANGTAGVGGSGSSLGVSTGPGGPYTTVSSGTIISPVNGPLVRVSGSSFTVDLSSVVMAPSTVTFSGLVNFNQRVVMSSSLFTNGAAVDDTANVILGSQFAYLKNGNIGIGTISPASNLEFYTTNDMTAIYRRATELAQGFISLWFLTGTGSPSTSNSLGMIRMETIQADPAPLQGAMQFFTNGGDSIRESARLTESGRFGIGISSPAALLHVSSGAGTLGPIMEVSTGATKLFEVNGTSVVIGVPLYDRSGNLYSTSTAAGGSTPDNGFTLAQSTINSRLDGLTAGASFYIKNSSTPSSAVLSASSGTFSSTLTVGGLITPQLTVSGPSGVIQSLNGAPVNVVGGLSFTTTWYTGIAFPVSVGSVGMQNSINFSTNNLNGRAYYDGTAAGSATTNASFYQKSIPQTYIAGTTPTLTRFVDFSTGVTTQNRAYIISFATASLTEQHQNLVYTSTVIYTVSGNTPAAGGAVTTRTKITLPTVWSLLGSGDCVLWIRIARDGDNAVSDPAQSNSVLIDVGTNFQIQL